MSEESAPSTPQHVDPPVQDGGSPSVARAGVDRPVTATFDRPATAAVDRPTSAAFARTIRTIAIAWIALIVLLLVTLGGAWLDLGSGNLWLGLAIAAVKAAIVLWLFMRLGDTKGTVKVAAAAGLFILALLIGLSATDYRTRIPDPAAWTSPLPIAPFIQKGR